MKIVEYHGHKIRVPKWCKYLATDPEGEVYAFDRKPVLVHEEWAPSGNVIGARFERIRFEIRLPDGVQWFDSLVDVVNNKPVEV